MTIQENVSLAPLTTLQVGGAARYFAELKREDEVHEAAQFAKSRGLPLFVLGGGSNLVVADSGWPDWSCGSQLAESPAPPRMTPRVTPFSSAWAPASTGRLCRASGGAELRGSRVPERHSRQRRRHARAKRWRLWAGGFQYDRIGARARFEGRPRCDFAQASVRIPLSHQHL